MKAMLLAAGHGMRMRPLTENIPKPLLQVCGKPLLQHHIESLSRAGITEIVINHARLGRMIESCFGDGSKFGVDICYSAEGDIPLETGGGIKRALPILGDAPFIVISADIYTDFNFARLTNISADLAHLVLVDNPAHHPHGDFCLVEDRIQKTGGARLTYANIGIFTREFFSHCQEAVIPLGPLLDNAIDTSRVTGEYFSGYWVNVGTPDTLTRINNELNVCK
jgi:MurNAc alpha-1-phosphate uridylyltransferase